MNKLLGNIYIMNGIVFIYLVIVFIYMSSEKKIKQNIKILTKEKFCTCRGAGFNNSNGDPTQQNCYKDKIPKHVWEKSHAGCTTFDDAGKISYAYNVLEQQLPDFMGV